MEPALADHIQINYFNIQDTIFSLVLLDNNYSLKLKNRFLKNSVQDKEALLGNVAQ